jgi:hypothetical protein
MAIRSLGKPQTKWENDVKNDLNIMKIYNWKDCIQDHTNGKKSLRRTKHSIFEVVDPEEEEEEEEEKEEEEEEVHGNTEAFCCDLNYCFCSRTCKAGLCRDFSVMETFVRNTSCQQVVANVEVDFSLNIIN